MSKRIHLFLAGLTLLALQQPDASAITIPVTEDAAVSSAVPGANYGGYGTDVVSAASGNLAYSYFRFDLANTLPTGTGSAQVAKAVIHVFVSLATSAGNIDLFRVTGPWSEGTGTGGTAVTGTISGSSVPTDAGGTPSSTTAFASVNPYHDYAIDVTPLVKGWLSGTYPNYGVVLKPSSGSAVNVSLVSKEGTVAHGPFLDITLYSARVPVGGNISMGSFTAGVAP